MNSARSFSRLKADSRQNLAGHYMTFFLALLVAGGLFFLADSFLYNILSPLLSGNVFVAFLSSLMVSFLLSSFYSLLEAGVLFISLNISRRSEASMQDLFLAFRYHPETAVMISLIISLIRTLCALPFDILSAIYFPDGFLNPPAVGSGAGAVMAYSLLLAALILNIVLNVVILFSYSQAFYLYIDHQEYNAVSCLKESRRLMSGNKLRYFLLNLSFLGYGVISILSMGIGFIWTIPYYEVSLSGFYMDLSGKYSGY